MEFRRLKYFVAVAEELSFSAAARRLHISQPPLSMQIKAMEDELGTALFERTSRQVKLTEAGRLFLVEARRALEYLNRAGEVVRQVTSGEGGEIRVAFTASVPMFEMFPNIIQHFRTRCPAACADLMHMSTGQQLHALTEKSIDVGFLRPSILFCPPPDITTVQLAEERLVAVLPMSHPLAKKGLPVSVAALASEAFIQFPRGLGCGLFEHIGFLTSRAGFAPRILQEAREGSTIIGLVAAGMGISILPETYTKTGIPGVAYLPLDTPDATSKLLLAYRTYAQSFLLLRFLESVQPHLGKTAVN
jgi:DNA-binding transcriptional LysR family regulator